MNVQILKDILSSRKEDIDSDNEQQTTETTRQLPQSSLADKRVQQDKCCSDMLKCPNFNLSNIEAAILNSIEPIDLNEETEEIIANGDKYVWANKSEISNWVGPISIDQYPINDDPNPMIITKNAKCIQTRRDIIVKYLEPPGIPIPGKIIVNQVNNFCNKINYKYLLNRYFQSKKKRNQT